MLDYARTIWSTAGKSDFKQVLKDPFGVDCGVFMLMRIYCLAKNIKVKFSQDNMETYREQIKHAILSKNLEWFETKF